MPENSSFTASIDTALCERLKEDLKAQDFEITTPQHTLFSAKKKGVSCTLYKTGKLLVQGKEMGSFIEFYLEPNILKTFTHTYPESDIHTDLTPRIGIDESGKGDFFGPLCVAGVFAEGEGFNNLKKLGVKDSKQLDDTKISKIAPLIQRDFVHHIVKINPPKYNELILKFRNLNKLLAWGHATTIENLYQKTNCLQVTIDQFADEHVVLTALDRKKLDLNVTQRHRGEEDIVVAAASILARYAFIEGLAMLEKKYGQAFPKGASKMTIEAGRKFVDRYGEADLNLVGKTHFKTIKSILS